jgi:hypothetical protein
MTHDNNDRRPARPTGSTGRTWQPPRLTRLRADATAAGAGPSWDATAMPAPS